MLLLSLTMTVSLFGNNIESCINSFNKKPGDVKIANAFFAELSKEEFIDDKVKFTADTPRDSVSKFAILFFRFRKCNNNFTELL